MVRRVYNHHVTPALKAAWPIIFPFFLPIGLALYLWNCLSKHIRLVQQQGDEQAKRANYEFTQDRWKNVVGSNIHCVGGNDLRIAPTLIVMQLLGFSF